MHILLIHQAFVSPNDSGGTRHFEFARRLVRRGHEVTIVASNLNYQTGKPVNSQADGKGEETWEGVNVVRAYTFPALHRSFAWRIVAFLSFMLSSFVAALRVKKVDVVWGTSPPMFQALTAWAVSRLRRRPFLLEVRDLWPEVAVEMGVLKSRSLIWLARRMERFLYKRAIRIIVNVPFQDYLATRGVPPAKVCFIPNGVDAAMFAAPADQQRFRVEHGLSDKFLVVYAGALGMANDIDTILDAAVQLHDKPDIHFMLVGDGKERPRLEAKTRSLNLSNVTFAGAQSKSQMPQILSAADACIATLQDIPLFRIAYPNKIFDYMAAGRPIVLAIEGVIRDVIETAGAGIPVPPGHANAISDAILQLRNQPENARRMGIAGRDYVTVHFNRDRHAKQLNHLLIQVAGKRAA
ncbi:MAG: glycosyltransferase family 4 protein [Planctomycetes bacterium]|nr:glycosyltransferase family 4 protein [Planctomycetota bacterium]